MANYLYNGVELPALPEYDKNTYPYAYIIPELSGDGFELATLSNRKTTPYKNTCLFHKEIDTGLRWVVQDGAWVTTSFYGVRNTPVIWSNTDIYYKDNVEDVGGTIYLAASEPVPVPDEPESVLVWKKHDAYAIKAEAAHASVYLPASDPVPVDDRPNWYQYNGRELPALPEWDKEKYPYAIIGTDWLLDVLFFSSVPLSHIDYATDTEYPRYRLHATDNGSMIAYTLPWLESKWQRYETADKSFSASEVVYEPVARGDIVYWANYDVPNYVTKPTWSGHTFYKVIGNKWVKRDAVVPAE